MDLQDLLKNSFYFTVGATAVGLEAIAHASKTLTKKGAVIVKKSKANFIEFCEKTDFSSLCDFSSAPQKSNERKD